MSAGGFCFGKYVLNYAYGTGTVGETIRSWGLAVHKARCVAFMEAYNNEITNASGLGWSPIQTRNSSSSSVGELYEMSAVSDGASSSGQTYYIQDWAPTTFDTNSEWPAFVSFFRYNGGSQEYCLITYRSVNINSSWSDSTVRYNKGLYINKANIQTSYDGSQWNLGQSYMHAFAPNGFNNYNVQSSDFLSLGSTKIFPCVFRTGIYESNQTDYSSYLIGCRSQGDTYYYLLNKSFSFGYAVKQDIIEFFLKSSDYSEWDWGLIGNIFGNLAYTSDTYTCGCLNGSYGNSRSDLINGSYDSYSWYVYNFICYCDCDGNQYDPNVVYGWYFNYYAPYLPMAYRTSSSAPSDIRYNAIPIACYITSTNYSSNDPGVDGDGNGFKGFLNTDIIRGISGNLCQNFGATLNNDKFITMCSGSSPYGFILGWDSSNESLYNS